MEKGSMSSTRMRNWNMNKLIPLSLAAVFALTSGFTMAATDQGGEKASQGHSCQGTGRQGRSQDQITTHQASRNKKGPHDGAPSVAVGMVPQTYSSM